MRRILIAAVLFLVSCTGAWAQDLAFGKNKVQYKKFDWQYIQSEHFDVYYSQDGYELASFAASAAEDAYQSIKKLFRYDINSRISFVVYNSHNEFQQTNVLDEYMEEGIGGVTELFKNRIVVPFDGSFYLFRHVIHHELVHAVMNDMFYGGTIQSLISSRSPLILPIWVSEGLAEYAALQWDTNSDMFIRDATLHNYLPPIEYLNGYFAYRGGQCLFNYIANKYGEQKIGELLNRIKGTRSIDGGFKSAIGLTVKELSERWEKEQRRLYYPDVARREDPEDFAKRLTDHIRGQNFYNSSPSISPMGDKIAFLTDRDDYFDIYLMSASDGQNLTKLVDGQRTKDFEELHLLTPGITWSPDGRRIAIAAKSGDEDAIMLVDVESGDKERLTFGLDAIYSISWSRDGGYLAIAASKAPQTDIYLYNLKTGELRNLTNDIFSDADPMFSPDGKTIYFSSDRGDRLDRNPTNVATMRTHDFRRHRLYGLRIETGAIAKLTQSSFGEETCPVPLPDGKKILYLSDRSGINNVYELTLDSAISRPLTNSLSGIYQLSISYDGAKLAFASLFKAGFDVFLLRAPSERVMNVPDLEPTDFAKTHWLNQTVATVPARDTTRGVASAASGDTLARRDRFVIVADTGEQRSRYQAPRGNDYSSFVFTEQAMRDTNRSEGQYSSVEIANNIDAEGNYIPRKYKLNFTPDLVYGTAAYSTFYGVQGATLLAFSDMLGDHRLYFETNLMLDLKNSDYALTYLYLPYRVDFGLTGFHTARFLYVDDTTYAGSFLNRFRNWGFGLSASYPIDHYNRIDFGVTWLNMSRENLEVDGIPSQKRSFLLPSATLVHDNSLWTGGWFAPNNGSRWQLSVMGSTKYSSDALEFLTVTMDYRNYNKLSRDFIFVYRLSGGFSNGLNRQSFFIGGTDGWINREFENNTIPIQNVEDYVFLSPVLPLRGYNYNVQNGTRYALANLEMRFPLVKYLILGALPIGFSNILGTVFFDVGSSWRDERTWKAFTVDANGHTVTNDLLMGTGMGTRLIFFGLPFRIDVAWKFEYSRFSQPVWYFSLGPEF